MRRPPLIQSSAAALLFMREDLKRPPSNIQRPADLKIAWCPNAPSAPIAFPKLNIVIVNKPLCFDDNLSLILLKPMVGAQGIEPWTSPV
jgi:hypothetical protein